MSLEQHMAAVLYEATRTLFPLAPNPRDLIKRHTWRDRRYLGEVDGKVLSWKGLSTNLVQIDFRYRAIFLDLVQNILPIQERHRLFGPVFTQNTLQYDRFVVMFVLDFPLESEADIVAQGFVPRRMNRALHACVVAHPEEFLSQSVEHWTAKVVRLVLLQRVLSTHRKPLDANEVPFQNLLYQTGYLHSYIVKGGLELHQLSKPRRAGGFGHDFHAVVANPQHAERGAFSLGIEVYNAAIGYEVYNAAIGYHVESILGYVRRFDLAGMIVVSKDDPFPSLLKASNLFQQQISRKAQLITIGDRTSIGIHHLPLDTVIYELQQMHDAIGSIVMKG